ncbi:cupin domain-containing protein [Ferruginibacter sp.]
MKKILILLFLFPLAVFAQQDSIVSGAYEWQQPVMQKNKIASTILVQGKAHDFEWMQLNSNAIYGTKPVKLKVPVDLEEVIIVRLGAIRIHLGDSVFVLTPNSVAVLMPGQKYVLQNAINEPTQFYTMQYRKKNYSEERKTPVTRSFVKMDKDIPFKPNTIGGGRRDFFECATVMQKRFEIHLSTLKEGIRSHDPHTHKAEEIVLMISGDTEMQVGDQFKKVNPGGFYYLGSNVLHAIKNTGTTLATYFAIQFE